MRAVVSYSDLDPLKDDGSQDLLTSVKSADGVSLGAQYSQLPPAFAAKAAKTRTNKRRRIRGDEHLVKASTNNMPHWDDPGVVNASLLYDNPSYNTTLVSESSKVETGREPSHSSENETEEESRELTYEEVWDDSALVDAWNSANAEYEAMNGKNKDWKYVPVKKSPLWYNTPPSKPNLKDRTSVSGAHLRTPERSNSKGDEYDSQAFDFNTFVPAHDPSLTAAGSSVMPTEATTDTFTSSQHNVSADEAFSRALNAMYWCGYWTATYHAQKRRAVNDLKLDDERINGRGRENEDGDG